MAKKFKMTKQHKFLGTTLPKAIGGAAKFAFKQPLTVAGAYIGAKLMGSVIRKGERTAKRSSSKQWVKRDNYGRTKWIS